MLLLLLREREERGGRGGRDRQTDCLNDRERQTV